MTIHPIYHKISGAVVLLGFGSIGRGTLPLILRHFDVDRSKMVVIDPDDTHRELAEKEGVTFRKIGITKDNFKEILGPLLKGGGGFVVNLTVDVSSLAMMDFARKNKALYIDTVMEPWPGFYDNPELKAAKRSNYALRETLLNYRRKNPGGTTAINCCGANPGMVSWFVKQALLNIAEDVKMPVTPPTTREGWGQLMMKLGVKGIHVAERDTQRSKHPKPMNVFVNTWSVDGFVSEGLQPAELGWGTHEKKLPPHGKTHRAGCGAAIYMMRPGAGTRVRSWTPTANAQFGFLVTHNEAISISDYFTVRDGEKVVYRPTCHYAYHPCNDAVLSLHEMAGNGWQRQKTSHILDEKDIVDGMDELGVLIYGHAKNAYWYGSQLSIEETRRVAPYQNATGLQVTSAVLAGMVWALENPERGVIEADEMDYNRCLEVQTPYLGPVIGTYTDWTPIRDRLALFPDDIDRDDAWQFTNVLAG